MIIAFTGKMGVGKSTAVEIAKSYFEHVPVELVKFAGPLYEIQETIYNRIADVYTRPKSFTKDRKLLQWLGTEWGRGTISDTLWVDLWAAETKRNVAGGDIVVCDDVRFDNEAQLVKDLGGIVIQLTSDKASRRIDTVSGIVAHSSESGIASHLVDHVVTNDGSKTEFRLKLIKIYYDQATKEGLV